MRYLSPLRYPGGKARLAGLLRDLITLNDLDGCEYYEPFAGGAGAALALFEQRHVSKIHLNDADERIFAFWQSCLSDSKKLASLILNTPLNLDEWYLQRTICESPSGHSTLKVGFAALYMNRCNRSGVISNAGPIGGYEQQGRWGLEARFYRESLARRILQIGQNQDRISMHQLDALTFLKEQLPRGLRREQVLVYLDPPYVQKGRRLYLNAYESADHARLSRYLHDQSRLPWFASYDDAPLVRRLYAGLKVSLLPIQYSLQVKRMATELAIAPHHLALPVACKVIPADQLLKEAGHKPGVS